MSGLSSFLFWLPNGIFSCSICLLIAFSRIIRIEKERKSRSEYWRLADITSKIQNYFKEAKFILKIDRIVGLSFVACHFQFIFNLLSFIPNRYCTRQANGTKSEFEDWECHFNHFWCRNGRRRERKYDFIIEKILNFYSSILKNENAKERKKWRKKTVSLQQDC